MRDLVDTSEGAVVAHPHDTHEEESRGMDNQCRSYSVQGCQAMARVHFQIQNEQREDNRENAVAEEFDTVLVHWRPRE